MNTPILAGTWTDHGGVVHILKPDAVRTLCGKRVESGTALAWNGCDECVRQSIKMYALTHVCGKECRDRATQAQAGERTDVLAWPT